MLFKLEFRLLFPQSLTWCIEGVDFLSNYDIMSIDQGLIDPIDVKEQLDNFQAQFPPPSTKEISLLTEAVASMDSQWTSKEGFEFALNRIKELHDRFAFYNKLLDEMTKEPAASPSSSPQDTIDPHLLQPEQYLGRTNRRLSTDGKTVQVSVLDVDKRANQALDLLEKTDQKISKKTRGEDPAGEGRSSGGSNNCSNGSDEDCVSLLEFLSEVDRTETPPTLDLLDLPESRSRSYSAPEESTDGDGSGSLKRSRSLTRKSRQKLISPLPVSSCGHFNATLVS